MLAQAAIIVAVVIPFGFELHPAGALVGLADPGRLLRRPGRAVVHAGLASKNQEWMFWAVQQTLLFPLLLLAGMLLPIDGGPGWLQAVAQAQPADAMWWTPSARCSTARSPRRRCSAVWSPPSWSPWSASPSAPAP